MNLHSRLFSCTFRMTSVPIKCLQKNERDPFVLLKVIALQSRPKSSGGGRSRQDLRNCMQRDTKSKKNMIDRTDRTRSKWSIKSIERNRTRSKWSIESIEVNRSQSKPISRKKTCKYSIGFDCSIDQFDRPIDQFDRSTDQFDWVRSIRPISSICFDWVRSVRQSKFSIDIPWINRKIRLSN